MTLVNTTARIRKANISLDPVALFDVLLIAVMLTMLSSKFLLSPGFGVEITASELPELAEPELIHTDSDLAVLTASGNSMLIFDGAIYNITSFRRKLEASKGKYKNTVLLLKADKNVDAQTLIDICSTAKRGGFSKVQIASRITKN